jgi:hypothetical protein
MFNTGNMPYYDLRGYARRPYYLGRKTALSIDTLLRESGFSEKAIEEVFKYYGQRKEK